MKIDFAKLQYQYQLYKTEIDEAIQAVLDKLNYILGEEITQLESSLQEFAGAKHAITCSSGTDALLLAMMAIDIQPGDEVITTPFFFIATTETIAFLKAKPVFVDIDEKTYNIDSSKIEEKVTDKTKAIIPVSLYGQTADMDEFQAIADKHDLKVIIDGAQSFGSTYKDKTDSNLGDISTTSFFPSKPLGCFGDGGGRMDTLQAAVLNVKLKYYEKDLKLRQEVAEKYTKVLENKDIVLPFVAKNATSAWAQYSVRIQNRDEVQIKLKEQGIPTAIHYPMPLHLQECFEYLGYSKGDFPIVEQISNEIMSLPMNPYLMDKEIAYIGKKVMEIDG